MTKLKCLLPYYYKMTSNDNLRELGIKNCTCHDSDEIININDNDFKNIKVNKKSQKDLFLLYLIRSMKWCKELVYCFK